METISEARYTDHTTTDFSADNFDELPQADHDHYEVTKEPQRRTNGSNKPKTKKRKAPDDDSVSHVAKFLRVYNPQKNPISVLNEMQLASAFSEGSAEGPSHQALFRFQVAVDGVVYEGEGKTKKAAKESAARKAVDALLASSKSDPTDSQTSNNAMPAENSGECTENEGNPADKTVKEELDSPAAEKTSSDLPEYESGKYTLLYRSPAVPTNPATVTRLSEFLSQLSEEKLKSLEALLNEANAQKSIENPTGLINRICDFLKLPHSLADCDPDHVLESDHTSLYRARKHATSFIVKFSCAEETFFARSHSKKLAKQMVACEALNWILDVIPAVWRRLAVRSLPANDLELKNDAEQDPRHFAAELFSSVAQTLSDVSLKHAGTVWHNYICPSVTAGICMSVDGKTIPVALATGSAVIYRKHLGSRGRNIKDCQSEILVLRAVRKVILDQIVAYYRNEETVFEKPGDDGLLVLKPGISFSLFLSRYPSGSCNLLAKEEQNAVDKKFHYIDGEIVAGNVHVVPEEISGNSLWDVTEGHEKLRVMSASDKLTKALAVGIQGALASCFCRPIFLKTIALAADIDIRSMSEALHGRLLDVSKNEENEARLSFLCPELVSSPIVNQNRFAVKDTVPLKGFVWHADVGSPSGKEVFLETTTGLPAVGTTIDINNASLGALFMTVAALMKSQNLVPSVKIKTEEGAITYAVAKRSSKVYRENGIALFRKTALDSSLGPWISKCEEEEAFALDMSNVTARMDI